MPDVETDIRIFPNKEMFSVDMAEIIDAAALSSGIIQGCTISLVNGVLSITNGRILINGRLGVVKGGNIPIPTLDAVTSCHLVAVCDLSSSTNPFYISFVTPSEYETLQASRDTTGSFNVVNGLDFIDLGTATIDPATSKVTAWSSAGVVAKKSKDTFNALSSTVNTLNTTVTNLSSHDSNQGIRAVTATLGNMAFDSTGAINRVVSVASVIPAGYTAIAAIPFASGSYAAYFYLCGMETATSVRVQMFRGEWKSVTQTNPSVVLICIRNL